MWAELRTVWQKYEFNNNKWPYWIPEMIRKVLVDNYADKVNNRGKVDKALGY